MILSFSSRTQPATQTRLHRIPFHWKKHNITVKKIKQQSPHGRGGGGGSFMDISRLLHHGKKAVVTFPLFTSFYTAAPGFFRDCVCFKQHLPRHQGEQVAVVFSFCLIMSLKEGERDEKKKKTKTRQEQPPFFRAIVHRSVDHRS